MDFIEFWTICASNGIVFDKDQNLALKRYHDELAYWNERVNMVSRKDIDNLLVNHILHSLMSLKYVEPQPKARCIDIGTGGGLPGIPLSIVRPDMHMLLVDSISKKLKTTAMMASHTGIKTLKAVCSRAELLGEMPEYRGKFDFIYSRAVARTVKILDWSAALTKSTTKVVLYKGGDLTEEIDEAKASYPSLKYTVHDIDCLGVRHFTQESKKILIIENPR